MFPIKSFDPVFSNRGLFNWLEKDWPHPLMPWEMSRPHWNNWNRWANKEWDFVERKRHFEINETNDKIQLRLDVHQFAPEEISVKITNDYLVIEGNHEERPDANGYITRTFKRRYQLPTQNIDMESVDRNTLCNFSSDGILMITIPKMGAITAEGGREKMIPIINSDGTTSSSWPLSCGGWMRKVGKEN